MKKNNFSAVMVLLIFLGVLFSSSTVKVMPVGDSLTMASDPGYRGYLYKMLKDSGFTVDFVGGHQGMPTDPINTDADNSGFGGYVIGPDASVLDQYHGGAGTASINWELDHDERIMSRGAQVIVMMIGTNDFWNNTNPAYNPGQVGAVRLDSLVEKIYRLSPNVKLVLSNLTPLQTDLSGGFASKFNSDVVLIVAKQKLKGRECYFVDNNKRDFVASDYADNIHFNAIGYAKLAKNFYKALAPVLKEMGSISSVGDVKLSNIVLYPNPAKEYITIKNIDGEFTIINLLGKIVVSKRNYDGGAISLMGLASGSYIVKTSNATLPFIKY